MHSTDNRHRVLLIFSHGLGDAVQLTSVLLHLRHYHPDWDIDVATLIGKDSVFHGLARQALILDCDPIDRGEYDLVYSLAWWECDSSYVDSPSTKAERCLREVFKLEPRTDLCRYQINIGPDAHVLHYEGNTAIGDKNLSHETAKAICEVATRAKWTPLILDWDHRSPLPNDRTIFCPRVGESLWKGYGTGDAEHIAALVNASSLFIGVDSGPQKIAGATSTPALGVWTGHHPVHYFGLANNFLHICPQSSIRLIRGNWQNGDSFFREHYRHTCYANLTRDLIPIVEEEIGARVPRTQDLVSFGGFWVRSDNISQDLLIVRDVYDNDAYRTELQLSMLKSAEVIVDVGAHIGSFARLCHERNPHARIICIEACPDNLEALRMNVGMFAEVVHAACTYETEPMGLLNAIRPNCESTGSSVVVPLSELESYPTSIGEYRVSRDRRFLPTITLEEVMLQYGCKRINLLKLDCEGCEISILDKTPSLDRIDFIMGEYHNDEKWEELRGRRLGTWDYGHMCASGTSGVFHLRNTSPRR
jgi:FkbM family methyltransferase